jgi:hypothetical protein
MVNQDIVKYLEEGKRRGFSIQLLKKKLLEAGFQEKDVDDAIAAMNVQQTIASNKIDLFDKSQDSKYQYQFAQPKEQQMPIGPAQQFRQLPGQQTTFFPPQTSMQPPGQFQPMAQPLQGIQQKPEVKLEEKRVDQVKSGGEGKWMKVGGILGILILIIVLAGVALNFFANGIIMNLMQNNLTVLIICVVFVLMFSLYTYAFVRVGKKTNQRVLVLGSWFTIVPMILYLILLVVAGLFVYEQAINFFSGTDGGGSYKITLLILAILWAVALLLHVIGMILSAVGMIKTGRDVRMMNVAGILNIFVFVCGLGVLVGIIILVYNILNAFSVPDPGMGDLSSILGADFIAKYSLMGLLALKAISIIFETIGLFNASKKYE